MASDAGICGEASPPGQISRRGCLFVLLTLVITAAVLTCAALFVLHRLFPAPPVVWSNNGEQFAQLRSLQGTWQDSVGGKITFTDTSFAPGDGLVGGKVTFVNVPQVFSWAVGPPPPSYGHGTWEVGTDFGDMMGLQNQPGAGVISIQFGSGDRHLPIGGTGSRRPRLRAIVPVRIPGPHQCVHVQENLLRRSNRCPDGKRPARRVGQTAPHPSHRCTAQLG